MKRSMLGLAIGAALIAAAGSAQGAVLVTDTFANLGGDVGTYSHTSVLPLDASPAVSWSINISSISVVGATFIGSFTLPLTEPNYGVNPADLIASGQTVGQGPIQLWSHTYSKTELGALAPSYDLTVTVHLLADRTIRTTFNVNTLTQFTVLTNNLPQPTPLSNARISGSVVATTIPAPTAMAPLAGAGLLTLRRRRR